MTGGAGADYFRFHYEGDLPGIDSWGTITDFNAAQGDKIQLNLLREDFLGDPFLFIGGQQFHGKGIGEVRLTGSGENTIVHVDYNGDGIEDGYIVLEGLFGFSTPGEDAFIL